MEGQLIIQRGGHLYKVAEVKQVLALLSRRCFKTREVEKQDLGEELLIHICMNFNGCIIMYAWQNKCSALAR